MKSLIARVLRRAGFEVRRVRPVAERIAALERLCRLNGVTHVLDVGANEGQFATDLRAAGWTGPITSFEPLSVAHAALSARAAGDPGWSVAPRAAVGAKADVVTINVAGNSQSSSLLPMLDRHRETAPESAYVGREEVRVVPLDDMVADATAGYLLKIDVQGFESAVLSGAPAALAQTRVIYCEMALQPLYEGEKLFYELSAEIARLGFRCAGLFNGHFDGSKGEVLQCDGVFVR